MKAGIAAVLLAIALVIGGCSREGRLDALAERRVAHLEDCRCLSHEKFYTITDEMQGVEYGEVLANTTSPNPDFAYFLNLWVNSPPHYAVIASGVTRYGYYQREFEGVTYAVMVTERE